MATRRSQKQSVLRRFDLGQVAVHFQKDILRNLLGQTAVAGHAPGQRKHHGLVLVHELFKIRLPVVGHGSRFYSLIRTGACGGMQKGTRAGRKKFEWTVFRGETVAAHCLGQRNNLGPGWDSRRESDIQPKGIGLPTQINELAC